MAFPMSAKKKILATFAILGLIGITTGFGDDTKQLNNDQKNLQNTSETVKTQPDLEEKPICKIEPIRYTTTVENDANLLQGSSSTKTPGEDGTREVCRKDDGTVLSDKTIKQPVTEVSVVGTKQYVAPAPKPVPAPVPAPSPAPTSNCNPNYTPCIPNVPYDLNCPDVGMTVRVIGVDVYRLDRDKDGIGCE